VGTALGSLIAEIKPQIKKHPGCSLLIRGVVKFSAEKYCSQSKLHNFFSHPDYTVGSGITPDQPLSRFADYTAGREFHPAPKNFNLFTWFIIVPA
jgi:hypothetical protein